MGRSAPSGPGAGHRCGTRGCKGPPAGIKRTTTHDEAITIEHETFGDPAVPAVLLVMGFGAQLLGWDADFGRMLAPRLGGLGGRSLPPAVPRTRLRAAHRPRGSGPGLKHRMRSASSGTPSAPWARSSRDCRRIR